MTTAEGDLPTGTLTFLFTDIEGSTRLASQLGLQFSAQLAQHNRIVRDAISANHGTVSSTAGDSFFATFPDAASAVVAAVAAPTRPPRVCLGGRSNPRANGSPHRRQDRRSRGVSRDRSCRSHHGGRPRRASPHVGRVLRARRR